MTDTRRAVEPIERGVAQLEAEIADLRAILAPLLANPLRSSRGEPYCLFCTADRGDHSDDCPVLRKDALLGRSR